jgi:hypothetical protein
MVEWVGLEGGRVYIKACAEGIAHAFIYTLPLSLFTIRHHSRTGPLPIGYHYLLPPPTQPTLPLAPPLSCTYPTGINTLPNPATDILHPPDYEDGIDKEFRNVGCQEPDAGESPKKEQFTTLNDIWYNEEGQCGPPQQQHVTHL